MNDGGRKRLRSVFGAQGERRFHLGEGRIGVRTEADAEAAVKSLVLQRFADEHADALRHGLDRAVAVLRELLVASDAGDFVSAGTQATEMPTRSPSGAS